MGILGPMKLELMTPHVEPFGVFRLRKVPRVEKQLYLERLKKSVYNAEG